MSDPAAIGKQACESASRADSTASQAALTRPDGDLARSMLDQMCEGAATLDATRTIIYCNPHLATLVGRDVDDLLGRRFDELVVAAGREQVRGWLASASDKGARLNTVLTHATGGGVPHRLSRSAIEADGCAYTFVVVSDLSREHELAVRVDDRTTELGKRVRELDCLLSLNTLLARTDTSLDDVLGEAVALLPAACKYPEAAVARIEFDGRAWQTAAIPERAAPLRAVIHVRGAARGAVELRYRTEQPAEHEGPFFAEERALLDAVGEHLGRAVAQHEDRQQREERVAQLTAILENFPEHVYVCDPQTYEVLFVNRAYRELLGEHAVGRKCHEVIQGVGKPCEFCTNEIILRSPGKPHTWEYHNQRLGRTFLITDQAVRWPDGRDVRLELAVDVTERKEAELEHDIVLRSAMDGFWICDGDGRIREANEALAGQLGFSREELQRMSIAELEVAGSCGEIGSWMKAAREAGHARFESGMRCKGGGVIDVEISASYAGVHGGRFFAFVRDITEVKRTKAEMEELAQRLKLATDAAKIGVWDFDPRRDVLRWDARMHALFATDARSFSGTYAGWLQCVHPDDRDATDQFVRNTIAYRDEFSTTFRIVWPQGEVRHIQGHGRVVRDAAGNAERFIGVNWDCTDRFDAIASLRRNAEELKRSNEELEQFAYVASHDLQEPLRMTTSYLQLLERRYKDQLDQDAHEFIGYAVDGALRMKVLINDLLTLSRVGTRGKAFAPTDLNEIVQRVLLGLEHAITDAGAMIVVDALPTIRADATQLAQLLQNLIGNAMKFRGVAPPEVRIGAVRVERGWRFSVRDNGIGIDMRHAERVFTIFQRLHSREQYPGTGIGLAVCRKIVERHGGRIWVASELGQGTTMFFEIPDHVAEIDRDPQPLPAAGRGDAYENAR